MLVFAYLLGNFVEISQERLISIGSLVIFVHKKARL